MRVSSQKTSVIGGLLLSVTMIGTPCNASDNSAGLPEDLLEYLGTLVDQEGEWVDALELIALELNDRVLADGDAQETPELDNDDLAGSSNVSSTADDNVEEK